MPRTLFPFRYREDYYEEPQPQTAQQIVYLLNERICDSAEYFDDYKYPALPKVKVPEIDSLTGQKIEQPRIGWYAKWQGGVIANPKAEVKVILTD